MRLALHSDTHHNFGHTSGWPYSLPEHDVLILAGDISEFHGNTSDLNCVLEHFRSRTQAPILYLPGNHEFYHQEYHQVIERLDELCAELDIDFLHRRGIRYGDVAFHGCTLWSDFRLHAPYADPDLDLDRNRELWEGAMSNSGIRLNDFYHIRHGDGTLTPERCAALHGEERAWLTQALSESEASHNVVITHFAPCFRCVENTPDKQGLMRAYYVADCDDLVEQYQPDLWLYGHVHYAADFTHHGTRFVNNAHGYPGSGQVTGFAPEMTLEIGSELTVPIA